MGGGLLARFYKEYLEKVPELFLVAEENGRVVGFCMGYLCDDCQYMKMFVKHNFLRVSMRCFLLLLKGNKLLLKKMRNTLFKKKENVVFRGNKLDYSPSERGDLLSICVLDEVKGKGVASSLMTTYEDILVKKGRKVCQLTTSPDNGRANRFYEKHGYQKYLVTDTRVCYEKLLLRG